MTKLRSAGALVTALSLLALAATISPGSARGECRIARVDFTPEAGMQIAVWLEDDQGNFIDTLYVTKAVGTYGIGNRPGRYDLNSGLLFVYGRRQNALPVWAHHRGVTYPTLVFHDGLEGMLSHGANVSSPDPYFCAPQDGEDIDLITCPSAGNTGSDKGKFDDSQTSFYPPRQDIEMLPGFDDQDVLMFADMNDLDAVSRATPAGGQNYEVLDVIDPSLPVGNYVLWVEVSKEFDYNDTYNPITYPAPAGGSVQAGYGDPYQGQPSVVWQVPFAMGGASTVEFTASDYFGYGEMSGMSGDVNPPDATINTVAGTYPYDQDGIGPRVSHNYPSLGQARLQLLSGPNGMYRVRLQLEPSEDGESPGAPAALKTTAVADTTVQLSFTAPGDDGQTGTAQGYEVRYKSGEPMTEANFQNADRVAESLAPMVAGTTQTFAIDKLLPQTTYYVGVRANDECLAKGPLTILSFTTTEAVGGEVDSCFVATAAWGSLMDAHVKPLRQVRDRLLRKQVLGELFVEAYYTFGPALAEIIEPSADLRGLARAGLSPVVGLAESLLE